MHDFLSGLISGTIQTIIGHPLDTLKTWNQNKLQYINPRLTYRNLYKGIKIPLLQNPLVISTTLYTNNALYDNYNNVLISSFLSGILSPGTRFVTNSVPPA